MDPRAGSRYIAHMILSGIVRFLSRSRKRVRVRVPPGREANERAAAYIARPDFPEIALRAFARGTARATAEAPSHPTRR
jgi:hypothetical protein